MIAGYAIVRNSLFEEKYPGGEIMPAINNVYYQGVYRSMWEDVENYLSIKSLSNNTIVKEYEVIKKSDIDGTFIKISKDLAFTEKLIKLDKEIVQKNEIIALSSSYLNKIKKEVEEKSTIWLGYDIILLGGWSLLRHGVFENGMHSLLERSANINQYGLFNNLDHVEDFLLEYNRLAALDLVDPVIENLRIDYVRVGLVNNL